MLNPSFSYPEFWRERTWKQACLLPLACLYQIGYRLRRLFVRAYTPSIPVLCIGNLVAGGAGKTPVALAVGQWAHENSLKACYLSRGYGGSLARPAYVTQNHSAEDVGDEPLLLARTLPTMVAKNRVQGAKQLEQDGFELIIMDDGFQNPTLAKTASLVVVDAEYGFGNGFTLPAGPLREPVASGLKRANAMLLMGRGHVPAPLPLPVPIPVLTATLETTCSQDIKGKPVVAFSGIARPEQFFTSLRKMGASVMASFAFADHHSFTAAELARVETEAKTQKALLVTTAKDATRLPEEVKTQVAVADLTLCWQKPEELATLLEGIKGDTRA